MVLMSAGFYSGIAIMHVVTAMYYAYKHWEHTIPYRYVCTAAHHAYAIYSSMTIYSQFYASSLS